MGHVGTSGHLQQKDGGLGNVEAAKAKLAQNAGVLRELDKGSQGVKVKAGWWGHLRDD